MISVTPGIAGTFAKPVNYDEFFVSLAKLLPAASSDEEPEANDIIDLGDAGHGSVSTIFRWVQRYAPESNKRMRPHLKMSGTSYRLDETYVKVGKDWKYLYRAVDSIGGYHRVHAQRQT